MTAIIAYQMSKIQILQNPTWRLTAVLNIVVGINCRFWPTSASGLGHVTAAIFSKEYLMTKLN